MGASFNIKAIKENINTQCTKTHIMMYIRTHIMMFIRIHTRMEIENNH